MLKFKNKMIHFVFLFGKSKARLLFKRADWLLKDETRPQCHSFPNNNYMLESYVNYS